MPSSFRAKTVGALAIAAGCLAMTACSTIKSRLYDVDGVTSDERQVKRLNGIPTTLDVPTHVRITIEETRYFRSDYTKKENDRQAKIADLDKTLTKLAKDKKEKTDADAKANVEEIEKQVTTAQAEKAKLAALTVSDVPRPDALAATRAMTYELICRKELYTVDFKRPISGSTNLKLAFGEHSGGQYFKSIGQDLTDTSIQDIGDLVEKTAAAIPKLLAINQKLDDDAKAKDQAMIAKGLFKIRGTVAVQCFDIRDPLLSQRVQQFLEQHINACDPGCPTPNPAGAVLPPIVPANITPIVPVSGRRPENPPSSR